MTNDESCVFVDKVSSERNQTAKVSGTNEFSSSKVTTDLSMSFFFEIKETVLIYTVYITLKVTSNIVVYFKASELLFYFEWRKDFPEL